METYNDLSIENECKSYLDSVGLADMTDDAVDAFLTEHGLALPNRSYLARLAKSQNPLSRWKAVQDRFLPPSSLDALARDENPEIRALVAKHPNATREVMDILAADDDTLVRREVAYADPKRISLPVAFALLEDEDEWVRSYMVGFPPLGAAGISGMADDTSPLVRRKVATLTPSRKLMRDFLDNDLAEVSQGIAANPKAPRTMLNEVMDYWLEKDDEWPTIFTLIYHPSVTARILKKIAASNHEHAELADNQLKYVWA